MLHRSGNRRRGTEYGAFAVCAGKRDGCCFRSIHRLCLLRPNRNAPGASGHCQGASGSSGNALYLGPKPTHQDPSGLLGIDGTAIEVDPAQMEGLGSSYSWLGKSNLPIRGVAMITGNPPRRLRWPRPPALARLIPVIIGQIERDTPDVRRN